MALARYCMRFLVQSNKSNSIPRSCVHVVSTRLASSNVNGQFRKSGNTFTTRSSHTEAEHTTTLLSKDDDTNQSMTSKPTSGDCQVKTTSALDTNAQHRSVEFTASSKLNASKRHDFVMVFTCKVCETRSVKTMSKESYEKGIVIVRCGGCKNLHLIADRLGWFGEPSSVEDFLRAKGEEIRGGSEDCYELTLEDLAGWKGNAR
eukprot:TRINITY_DN7755_c0_g1_i1.p1 TRINITY_DN7755_c0_g1~~TRINITY_DN7755_c0_g1_i1.p1  ORF type:complete len:204 (-),score=32.32 TRINITY_DN7755_c0_g1_i1:225-836(-)